MTPTFRKLLNCIGSLIAIAGITFVLLKLNNYKEQIDWTILSSSVWLKIILYSALYGGANILLALAWRFLSRHFGANLSITQAVSIYGITQLAKYVPGNIFHFAGRQAMSMAAGLPGWAIAKSALWELAILSLAGTTFFILAAPLFVDAISTGTSIFLYLSVLGVILLFSKLFNKTKIAIAFLLYSIFLAVSGYIFLACIQFTYHALHPSLSVSISIISAFIIAWLAGLITPGSPAGIGIRELVVVFLLKSLVPESDLLIAVISSRIVTIFGDLLFFLYAGFLYLIYPTKAHTKSV